MEKPSRTLVPYRAITMAIPIGLAIDFAGLDV
jgi:hypothetical protein